MLKQKIYQDSHHPVIRPYIAGLYVRVRIEVAFICNIVFRTLFRNKANLVVPSRSKITAPNL